QDRSLRRGRAAQNGDSAPRAKERRRRSKKTDRHSATREISRLYRPGVRGGRRSQNRDPRTYREFEKTDPLGCAALVIGCGDRAIAGCSSRTVILITQLTCWRWLR